MLCIEIYRVLNVRNLVGPMRYILEISLWGSHQVLFNSNDYLINYILSYPPYQALVLYDS